jgi:hypothetical protein
MGTDETRGAPSRALWSEIGSAANVVGLVLATAAELASQKLRNGSLNSKT